MTLPRDHTAWRESVLARSRAIARDPADYAARLAELAHALTADPKDMTAYRRGVLLGAWATGAEYAARKQEKAAE